MLVAVDARATMIRKTARSSTPNCDKLADSPHSHSIVLIDPYELIYQTNISLTLRTSVAQTVK
jgi:hypothetical protein